GPDAVQQHRRLPAALLRVARQPRLEIGPAVAVPNCVRLPLALHPSPARVRKSRGNGFVAHLRKVDRRMPPIRDKLADLCVSRKAPIFGGKIFCPARNHGTTIRHLQRAPRRDRPRKILGGTALASEGSWMPVRRLSVRHSCGLLDVGASTSARTGLLSARL